MVTTSKIVQKFRSMKIVNASQKHNKTNLVGFYCIVVKGTQNYPSIFTHIHTANICQISHFRFRMTDIVQTQVISGSRNEWITGSL